MKYLFYVINYIFKEIISHSNFFERKLSPNAIKLNLLRNSLNKKSLKLSIIYSSRSKVTIKLLNLLKILMKENCFQILTMLKCMM